MALNEMSFALGPKNILEELVKRYSEREFLLYSSVVRSQDCLLVDISGKESVFETGLNYRIVNEIGPTDWDGLLELRYMTLDTDQQKVFNAVMASWNDPKARPLGLKSAKVLLSLKKSYQFLLLNVWEDEQDYLAWNHADDNKLAQFGHDGNKAPIDKIYTRLR